MRNKIFKLSVSAFIVAEICFLGGLLSVVIEEYDPVFIETAGLIMITYSIILGMGVLLFALYQLHKWNPNVILHLKNLSFLRLRGTI